MEPILLSSAWRVARIRLGDTALDQATAVLTVLQRQVKEQGSIPEDVLLYADLRARHFIAIAQAHYAAANVRSRWMPADE